MKGSKIFVPFMRTLSHMATVKVAMKLFNEFHTETLLEIYRRMQCGISMTAEDSKIFPDCSIAQKELFLIPPGLRKRVIEAIHGLHCAVELWKEEHNYILHSALGECIFYIRCDGTIDTVQTAQQLLQNPILNIRERFSLACIYCMEENIRTLWKEMQETGWIEDIKLDAVRFWVKWLRDGCRVKWQLATQGEFFFPPAIRFHPFFLSLRPDERGLILFKLMNANASYDDLRLCLYEMNEKEEEKVLREWPEKVLLSFFRWPFRNFLFEAADKILKYTDERTFGNILNHLLNSSRNREVFEFSDFLEHFWKRCPIRLRERVKEFPHLREKTELFLNEMKDKS